MRTLKALGSFVGPAVLLLSLAVRCSGSSTATVLQPNAHAVSGAALDTVSVLDGTLVFSRPEADALLSSVQPGDVLYSDYGDASSDTLPDAFMRKVISVSSDDDNVYVETADANVTDVFTSFEQDATQPQTSGTSQGLAVRVDTNRICGLTGGSQLADYQYAVGDCFSSDTDGCYEREPGAFDFYGVHVANAVDPGVITKLRAGWVRLPLPDHAVAGDGSPNTATLDTVATMIKGYRAANVKVLLNVTEGMVSLPTHAFYPDTGVYQGGDYEEGCSSVSQGSTDPQELDALWASKCKFSRQAVLELGQRWGFTLDASGVPQVAPTVTFKGTGSYPDFGKPSFSSRYQQGITNLFKELQTRGASPDAYEILNEPDNYNPTDGHPIGTQINEHSMALVLALASDAHKAVFPSGGPKLAFGALMMTQAWRVLEGARRIATAMRPNVSLYDYLSFHLYVKSGQELKGLDDSFKTFEPHQDSGAWQGLFSDTTTRTIPSGFGGFVLTEAGWDNGPGRTTPGEMAMKDFLLHAPSYRASHRLRHAFVFAMGDADQPGTSMGVSNTSAACGFKSGSGFDPGAVKPSFDTYARSVAAHAKVCRATHGKSLANLSYAGSSVVSHDAHVQLSQTAINIAWSADPSHNLVVKDAKTRLLAGGSAHDWSFALSAKLHEDYDITATIKHSALEGPTEVNIPLVAHTPGLDGVVVSVKPVPITVTVGASMHCTLEGDLDTQIHATGTLDGGLTLGDTNSSQDGPALTLSMSSLQPGAANKVAASGLQAGSLRCQVGPVLKTKIFDRPFLGASAGLGFIVNDCKTAQGVLSRWGIDSGPNAFSANGSDPPANGAACAVSSFDGGTSGGDGGSGSDGGNPGGDAGTDAGDAALQCTPGCTHDVCTAGTCLDASCSTCAAAVCAHDSYCCDTYWGLSCFSDVQKYCGTTCP